MHQKTVIIAFVLIALKGKNKPDTDILATTQMISISRNCRGNVLRIMVQFQLFVTFVVEGSMMSGKVILFVKMQIRLVPLTAAKVATEVKSQKLQTSRSGLLANSVTIYFSQQLQDKGLLLTVQQGPNVIFVMRQ
jgi:hypothetical protein